MKKTKQPTGLFKLTVKDHRFDGFSVRKQKNYHYFLRYCSANKNLHHGPKASRFAAAKTDALFLLGELTQIIDNPKSWLVEKRPGYADQFTLKARPTAEIKNLGFTIKNLNP